MEGLHSIMNYETYMLQIRKNPEIVKYQIFFYEGLHQQLIDTYSDNEYVNSYLNLVIL